MGKEIFGYILVAILCSAGIFAFLLLPDYISSKFMNQTKDNNQNTNPPFPSTPSSTPSNPPSIPETPETPITPSTPPTTQPPTQNPPISSSDLCTELFRCGPGSNYISNDETKQYFLCTCTSARLIPDTFVSCLSSTEEAESMGYTPGTC